MLKRVSVEVFFSSIIRAVAEVGIENLRTKTVAEYAGFSEATMFNYFKNKDDMLCQTFLEMDRRVSAIVLNSPYIQKMEEVGFTTAAFGVWHTVYRYLLDHPEETLYLIRFRYCALYNSEVRSKRQAYNGSFNRLYETVTSKLGTPGELQREFLLNYIFEMTICFAERIVTGRLQNTEEVEGYVWKVIIGALGKILSIPQKEENVTDAESAEDMSREELLALLSRQQKENEALKTRILQLECRNEEMKKSSAAGGALNGDPARMEMALRHAKNAFGGYSDYMRESEKSFEELIQKTEEKMRKMMKDAENAAEAARKGAEEYLRMIDEMQR